VGGKEELESTKGGGEEEEEEKVVVVGGGAGAGDGGGGGGGGGGRGGRGRRYAGAPPFLRSGGGRAGSLGSPGSRLMQRQGGNTVRQRVEAEANEERTLPVFQKRRKIYRRAVVGPVWKCAEGLGNRRRCVHGGRWG